MNPFIQLPDNAKHARIMKLIFILLTHIPYAYIHTLKPHLQFSNE